MTATEIAAPICRGGVDQARGQPRPAGINLVHVQAHQGRHGHALAQADGEQRQDEPRRMVGHGQGRGAQHAQHLDHHAEGGRSRAQPQGGPAAAQRAAQEPHAHRHERQPRGERATAQARLLVDGENQEERRDGIKAQRGSQAAAQPRLRQQRRREQRRTTRTLQALFETPESPQQRHTCHQQPEAPPGPSVLAAFDQGISSASRPAARRPAPRTSSSIACAERLSRTSISVAGTARATTGRLTRKTLRQPRPNQSAATSAPPGPVLPRRPSRRRPRTGPERGSSRAREKGVDRCQRLRRHDGGGQPLQQAADHQHTGGRGQPAQHRRRAEPQHAADENAPAAVQVAEPAAQDQRDGIRSGIHGNDHLRHGCTGRQVGAHGRQRDIDDEEIQRGQQGTGQQHGERHPAARIGTDPRSGLPLGQGCGFCEESPLAGQYSFGHAKPLLLAECGAARPQAPIRWKTPAALMAWNVRRWRRRAAMPRWDSQPDRPR